MYFATSGCGAGVMVWSAPVRGRSDMLESIATFFDMGGYAFYVWWSYAIAAVMLALNLWLPVARARRLRRRLARLARDAGPSQGGAATRR